MTFDPFADELSNQEKRRIVEARPGLFKQFNPRIYKGIDVWCSPEVPGVAFAACYLNLELLSTPQGLELARDRGLTDENIAIEQRFGLAGWTMSQYQMPTFFVAPDLAESLLLTDMADDIHWTDLKRPFDAGLFMLPKRFLLGADGYRYDWMAWAFFPKNARDREGALFDQLYLFSGTRDCPHAELVLTSALGPLRKLGEGKFEVDEVSGMGETLDVMNAVAKLVLGLFIVMNTKPEFVEAGRRLSNQTKASGNETWTPNVVGRKYVLPRMPHDGTHASPRMHWRRGHFRNQHFGKLNAETKIIWLEPTLVNAKTEISKFADKTADKT
jgi:hypothetical protein